MDITKSPAVRIQTLLLLFPKVIHKQMTTRGIKRYAAAAFTIPNASASISSSLRLSIGNAEDRIFWKKPCAKYSRRENRTWDQTVSRLNDCKVGDKPRDLLEGHATMQEEPHNVILVLANVIQSPEDVVRQKAISRDPVWRLKETHPTRENKTASWNQPVSWSKRSHHCHILSTISSKKFRSDYCNK